MAGFNPGAAVSPPLAGARSGVLCGAAVLASKATPRMAVQIKTNLEE